MKGTLRITGMLCVLCLLTGLLAWLLFGLGTSAPLMERLMRQHADIRASGLPPEELPSVVDMIASFLRGENPEFQHLFTGADGTVRLAFNTHEQAHMADVRQLFALCGRLRWLALAGLIPVICRRKHCFWQGWLVGAAIVFAALAALLTWAAVSFETLFVCFHRLFFTNDLWLMSYQRDLIIRLMPESFFVHYAGLTAACWGAGLLLLTGCGMFFRRKTNHG